MASGRHTFTVRASVGVRPSVHYDHVQDIIAELFLQPEQVSNILVIDGRTELHFDRQHLLVGTLDDDVDLAPPVVLPKMVYACIGVLDAYAHGLSHERLEEMAEEARRELLKLPFELQAKNQEKTEHATDTLSKDM